LNRKGPSAGRVILPGVVGELRATELPGGRQGQPGYFILLRGSYFPFGVYRLEIDDGRACDIDIPDVPLGSRVDARVPFTVLAGLR